MQHPMSGCWAKMERASELIGQIEREVAEFLASDPPPVRLEGGRFNGGREYGFTVFAMRDAPLRFSVLAGEVIHHLRSGLDHVIWALALRKTADPPRRIQFPIFEKKADFDSALKSGMLRGTGDDTLHIVASVQPYTSNAPDDTVLAVLARLDNSDKHRLLNVVMNAATTSEQMNIDPGEEGVAITGMSAPERVLVTPEGVRIFTLYFQNPALKSHVTTSIDTTVAFEKVGRVKGAPLVQTLRGIHAGVTHTLKRFDPLLRR